MKIAFIVDEFPSISQTFVLNQITGLLERGHHVDVFTRELTIGAQQHPDIARYRLMERTHHLACPTNRWTRVTRGAGLCLRKMRANPRAVLGSLNVFRYGRGALSLTLLFQTAPFFRRYDIVHCQFGHNGRFGAMLKKLGLQKKLVVTFHGYDVRAALEGGGSLYGDLWDEADCLIAISNYNRDHLLRFGGDPEKIVYHPVGIDCKRFGYKRSTAPGGGPVRILSVARLVQEKGLEFGIRAFHLLAETRPSVPLRYDIIGEGPLRARLQNLIDDLRLGASIRLLGAKSQNEVIEALRASDILLAPSLAEALPVSLMEAHAVGLPVLATQVGSVDQIVEDGISGFLVPPGDVAALRRGLTDLMDSAAKRADMGRRGRCHVEQHYDIDRLNDRLVNLYQELLAA
jgi:colanic acid/amylovoran/stewartan biosynthesis glycosyltransferase WcaL/AmsK/CpsK